MYGPQKDAPAAVAQACAKTVLLPLLPLLGNLLKSRTPRPDLPLDELSELAVRQSLEEIASKGGAFTRQDVSAMIDGAILGNNAQLLTST